VTARTLAAAVAALAVAMLATAWIGRIREGHRALADCDSALLRGDAVEAILFARAAAQARCPLCESPDLGYARLYAIAKEAEGRGDNATAIAAWRAVRTATITASVLDASPPRRERADVEIARLGHRIDAAAAAAGGTPTPAATEEHLRSALATSSVPSGATFVLLAFGGVAFFFGAARFAFRRGARADLATAAAGAALAASGVLLF
jgi:hypothetical protein